MTDTPGKQPLVVLWLEEDEALTDPATPELTDEMNKTIDRLIAHSLHGPRGR